MILHVPGEYACHGESGHRMAIHIAGTKPRFIK